MISISLETTIPRSHVQREITDDSNSFYNCILFSSYDDLVFSRRVTAPINQSISLAIVKNRYITIALLYCAKVVVE